MADYDIWIWHSFFGTTGSHDDINMPQLFPVFARLVEGHAPGHNTPKATILPMAYIQDDKHL
jgi:hypothetical protein